MWAAMAKARSQFVCQNCGTVHTRWAGKCDGCGEWNTLVEEGTSSGGIGGGVYGFLEAWKRSVPVQIAMDRLMLRLPGFGER